MMNILFRGAERLAFGMYVIAGILLVSLMLTTMADVFTRILFKLSDSRIDLSFFGGIEIVRYTLLFAILFSLPHSVSRGQVIVDLFTEHMSTKKKGFLAGFYTLGFGFLGLAMCFGWYNAALRVTEFGETTQDLLIPLQYLYATAAFASAILAIRGFLVGLEKMMHPGCTS